MTQKAKTRASKKRTVQRRRERRFAAERSYVAPWVALVGIAGALVLGAGVYGSWIAVPPVDYAAYLVALGGLGIGVALWFAQASLSAICVGDAGLALESGSETERLAWCDMESIRVEGGRVVVRAKANHSGPVALAFPLKAHPLATAWLFKEAVERTPDVMDVPGSVTESLPRPKAEQGERQEIDDAQVAGRRCAQSRKVIAFESDARLCPRCSQVYHKDNVPSSCVTCSEPLAGRTLHP